MSVKKEPKPINLGYRITKIQTTKFAFEDILESKLNSLLADPDALGLNINVGININKDDSLVTIDVETILTDVDSKINLVTHSARTVFFIENLKNTYNKETNAFDLPNELLAQIYGISYTHARALLSMEISPTVYREKYFLPIINPMNLVKGAKLK